MKKWMWVLLLLAACQMEKNSRLEKSLAFGQNEIYFETEGEGTPLVFIHGGGVDHRMWQQQFDYFKDHYKVIAYDIRGHGKSTFTENDQHDLEDLNTLLSELNISSIRLAGLSLGAILALDFTLAYPEKVDQLMLLSPGLIGVQEKDTTYLAPLIELSKAFQANDPGLAATIVDGMTFKGQRESIPADLDAARAYVKESFLNYVESGNFTRIPQIKEVQPVSRLSDIQCPVLLLYGEEDANYIHVNVQTFQDSLPNSTTHLVQGAAHLPNMEKPTTVNAAIEKFLRTKE